MYDRAGKQQETLKRTNRRRLDAVWFITLAPARADLPSSMARLIGSPDCSGIEGIVFRSAKRNERLA
jgi:hypothetical protein